MKMLIWSVFSLFSCVLSMKRLEHKHLTVDFDAIRQIKPTDFSMLMHLTLPEYRGYASLPPGSEHYTLLAYFAKLFSKSSHSFIDIGTRFGTSALALGAFGHSVTSFDIPGSSELASSRNTIQMTKEQWFNELETLHANITFLQADLLKISDEEFEVIRKSSLILLDTFHRPYTQPFEREFLDRLVSSKFSGIILLDDINQHEEMEEWWSEIICSRYRSFAVYTMTSVGHSSGTGLLDFSTRLKFIGKGSENILEVPTDPKCYCGKPSQFPNKFPGNMTRNN